MRTHILIIADMSGSMGPYHDDVIGGVNQYVKDRLGDEHAPDDDLRLSLVLFDDKYEPLYRNAAPDKIVVLTKKNYAPRGSTALNDAVGRALAELELALREEDRAFVLIFTDGQENASKEYTTAAVKARIVALTETGDWTFTFLGANQDAWQTGASYGVAPANAMSYDAADIAFAMDNLSGSTRRYRASPAKSMVGTTEEFVDKDGKQKKAE